MTDEEALRRITEAWWADTDWRTFGAAVLVVLKESGQFDKHPRPEPAPPRPPWIDPRACWAHCDPEGWHVPCKESGDQS